MTVRTRLQLWNTGILALTLIILGGTIRWAVHEYLYRAVDTELATQLQAGESRSRRRNERNAIREAAKTEEEQRIEKERDKLWEDANKKNEELKKMRPTDEPTEADTTLLFPRFVDKYDKPTDRGPSRNLLPWDMTVLPYAHTGGKRYSTVVVKDERLRLYTGPIGNWGDMPMVGQFAFRLTDIDRGMSTVDRTLLTLLPISLLLTSVIGAFLTRKAIQPIEDALTSEREALARQKRFVADASHELKTPLAIIKAAVGLGLDTATGSTQKTFERIDSATNRTNRIVSDLMLLAQSDNDQITPETVTIPLTGFLTETVGLFDGRAGERHITADAPIDLKVNADPHQLSRALSNLLDNAIRHTKPDGNITLVAHKQSEGVVITLTDDGEGP
jgi:hypothetical protein